MSDGSQGSGGSSDGTEAARVYDLDGTLVRLDVDWKAAERDAREVIAGADLGIDPEREDVWDLFDVAEEHGLTEELESRVSAHEIAGAEQSRRLPPADELEGLSVPVAVCSLNCEAACRIALERHDLTEFVDAVVGRDTVASRKPDPGPLLAAISRISAEPAETLFVGDSESDAVAAERAGTRFRYVDGAQLGS